jgi:hypothetical protein
VYVKRGPDQEQTLNLRSRTQASTARQQAKDTHKTITKKAWPQGSLKREREAQELFKSNHTPPESELCSVTSLGTWENYSQHCSKKK